MAETTNRNYPYPGGTVAANGPFAFQDLADAIDADVESLDVRLTAAEAVVTYRVDRAAGGDATFSGADVDLVTGTSPSIPAGVYRIEGFGALKSTAGTNGSTYVTAGSTTRYARNDLDPVWKTHRAVIEHYVHAGGTLYLEFGYDCPVGTAILAGPSTKQPCAVVLTQIGKVDA